MTEFLEETGIAKATGESSISGFCNYPLYQFDLKQIPWEDGVDVDSSCTVMIETAVSGANGNTTSETHHTIECDCESCLMNPHGICLAPLFTDRFPNWDTPDGNYIVGNEFIWNYYCCNNMWIFSLRFYSSWIRMWDKDGLQ